jgi:hypothetical protein
MHRSLPISSPTASIFTISLVAFLLSAFSIASAQVNSAEVTAVQFAQQGLPIGTVNSSAVVTGDFNNDGILDVVTIDQLSSGASQVSFFAGLGGGKFSATPVTSPINVSLGIDGPAFSADLNNDGKLDVAIAGGQGLASSTYPVAIMLGNGDGTFTTGVSITVATKSGTGNATAIALADFNGDHIPDIAISDGYAGYTWIYLGKGDGTFTRSDTQYHGGNSVVAGDFNNDGKQDVAFAGGSGTGSTTVGVFLGNGNGTLNTPVLTTITGGTGAEAGTFGMAVGDFYNNRIDSLAVLYRRGDPDLNGVSYLDTLQYSDGQLVKSPLVQFTPPVAESPTFISAGDLNGDFLIDVFITGGGYYENSYTEYMLGNGNGTFRAPESTPNEPQGNAFQLSVIRDLSLDSRHDIAMGWGNVEDGSGGGDVLINENATPNCDPPPASALSVNICAPANGATVPATYTFKAAGNAFSGVAKRMELWIDGKEVGENLEDQLNVTTTLAAGTHTASFVVVDTFDSTASNSVTFTTE